MTNTEIIECQVCGGTDFLKESGYFYCKECQTQSQEVREHVFQEENVNLKSTRKIKENKDKKENKLTSWECHNVIIKSLTQELINLGASEQLKPVIKCLWLRYLEKLEVLDLQYDVKPKLQLVNYRRDLDVLYDIKKKKKKRKRSSSEESFGESSRTGSVKRERTKRKTALIKAEYEELSQKSTRDSSSLHNVSLSSLKGSEQSLPTEALQFSSLSIKELKNVASSKYHVKKHKKDVLYGLKCHLGYRNIKKTYRDSASILSSMKVYCILYLGLLIIKDKIQLGDLFRFLREGHLSFNRYTELFPETYPSKHLNFQNNRKTSVYSHKRFREMTAKIAKLLKVTIYIQVPDLVDLSRRYCQEMNLPDAIFEVVENLISKTEPKLRLTKKQCSIIPNYEGRVMSMIIFILKLLFGLDGVTEFQFSNYAQCVNTAVNNTEMFDIKKWLEYIGYRQFIMNQYHLPSAQLNNAEVNSDLFLQYINSHDIKLDNDTLVNKNIKEYKNLLTILQDLQNNDNNIFELTPSLTPFKKYSEELYKSNLLKSEYSQDLLKLDFTKNSMNFLLFPDTYLKLFSPNIDLKNGGANDNWLIEDFTSITTLKNSKYSIKKLIPVEITPYGHDSHITETLKKGETKSSSFKYDCEYVQKNYHEHRKHIFAQNATHLKKICKHLDWTVSISDTFLTEYSTHYNPYERYWLYLLNGNLLGKKDIDKFFNNHTNPFKLIFQDCSRLVEQTYRELLEEFHLTELFLVFSADYTKTSDNTNFKLKRYLNSSINYYVTQAEHHW